MTSFSEYMSAAQELLPQIAKASNVGLSSLDGAKPDLEIQYSGPPDDTSTMLVVGSIRTDDDNSIGLQRFRDTVESLNAHIGEDTAHLWLANDAYQDKSARFVLSLRPDRVAAARQLLAPGK